MAPNLTRMFRNVLRSAGATKTTKPAAKKAPPTPPAPTIPGAPTRDSSLAGVTVEYNPDLDGEADPGEVVWTWVPWAEDPNQGKDRPVVIVGRRGSMLVGVPLTSKHHDNERQIAVGTGPWDREGRTSYAKLDRILDVDPAQIRREGSILGRAHFDEVVAALRAD
jgi:hypothetical protein